MLPRQKFYTLVRWPPDSVLTHVQFRDGAEKPLSSLWEEESSCPSESLDIPGMGVIVLEGLGKK